MTHLDRRIYLKMTAPEQARTSLLERAGGLPELPVEEVETAEAVGRVTGAAVYARASSPAFAAAAMDGYAVRSQLTFGASEAQPVTLEVPGQAEPINTGNPVPPDKDAVYKIEEVHQRADTIEMMTPTFPGQHVRLVGEEVTAGDLLVTAGEELQPRHIGRLLAAQVWTIPVRRKPTVAVIPTGAECLPIGQPPGKGQFVEYNGPMMAAALSQWGCVPQLHEPVPDEETALARAVSQATADSDIVLIIAGSSAGSRDFVPSIIARLGELLVHGVEMMPGKPLALGWIDNTPIIGLPGYSVAAWMCLQEFARPLITRRLGLAEYERPQVRARLQRKLPSTAGIEETLRVVMCDDGHQRTVVPLARGSGSIGSLAQAHGLLTIDQTREGLEAGTEVAVRLLVPRVRIERSIVAIGSHDLALAALAERLAERWPPLHLVCLSTGSTEGLTAIGRGEGMAAGTHLLDPETKQYNVSYIQRWLADLPLVMINLSFREVGLLVSPGNPKGINAPADLAREDVTFVNRQPGSGTRVLLDFLLKEHSIPPTTVAGYEREAYTHTMVAEAIRQGSADAGLGILAAARAFKLDFVPVTEERYDLVIPKRFLELARIEAMAETINDAAFRDAVEKLGGYSTRQTGEIVFEQ